MSKRQIYNYSTISTNDFQSLNLYPPKVVIAMFLVFTPYSFLFFSLYLIFLTSLSTLSRFYYYWIVIEIIMLLFMGISYTVFVSSYSQVIVYFLIQVISSFFILVFYIYSIPSLLTIAFLIKLSIFPFFMWYINVLYRFPNFILWLARTLHKIPAILIIKIFILPLNLDLLWVSIILTTLISGLIMLTVIDFRIVLVISSIGNNSWFILSQIANTFIFLIFIFVYTSSLFYILKGFGSLSKPSLHSSLNPDSYGLSLWVLSLSGMPPFPLFYRKILLILYISMNWELNYFFPLFLFFNSLIVVGYLQSIIKYFIYVYSTQLHYLLKY